MARRGVDADSHCVALGLQPDKSKLDSIVTKEHINEIAAFITEWQLLGEKLGLSDVAIEEVEAIHGGGEGYKKIKMLQKWRESQYLGATYRKLIEVLLSMEKTEKASDVCRLLSLPPTSAHASSKLPTPPETGPAAITIRPDSPGKESSAINDSIPANNTGLNSKVELRFIYNLPLTDWNSVGIELGISQNTLTTIRTNNVGDVIAQKREMFTQWLRQDINASYQKLIEAMLKQEPADKESLVKLAKNLGCTIEALIPSGQLNNFQQPVSKSVLLPEPQQPADPPEKSGKESFAINDSIPANNKASSKLPTPSETGTAAITFCPDSKYAVVIMIAVLLLVGCWIICSGHFYPRSIEEQDIKAPSKLPTPSETGPAAIKIRPDSPGKESSAIDDSIQANNTDVPAPSKLPAPPETGSYAFTIYPDSKYAAEPDLIDLMNDVASAIPEKWKAVGVKLQLSSDILDLIRNTNAEEKYPTLLSFEYVLRIWKIQAKIPYTWEKIIDILGSPSVQENQLARDLENKYLSTINFPQPPSSHNYCPKDNTSCNIKVITIVVVGRTGDGKSTLCLVIAQRLGLSPNDTDTFQSSSPLTVSSHTHDPETWISKNPKIRLVDTPGLMDTNGVEQDEKNIAIIVKTVSALEHVHGFILVMNEQAPRFDSGMQDAVKLLVDSFGPKCLNNFGIAHNRAIGTLSSSESLTRTNDITNLIVKRTGIHINYLPSWQVNCKPEELRKAGVTEEIIKTKIETRDKTLDEIIRWAIAKTPVDTRGSVIGEYEQRKAKRLAENRRKEDIIKNIIDSSVVSTTYEKKEEEYKRNSQPMFHYVARDKVEKHGWWIFGHKDYIHWVEKVDDGIIVTLYKRELQRTISTLGSGKKVYSEWITLREWTENVRE